MEAGWETELTANADWQLWLSNRGKVDFHRSHRQLFNLGDGENSGRANPMHGISTVPGVSRVIGAELVVLRDSISQIDHAAANIADGHVGVARGQGLSNHRDDLVVA